MREQIIADYHDLLRKDATLTPDFFARLGDEMDARGLVYGGRAVGVSLRPHLLGREEYDRLVRASEAVAAALETVTRALVAEPGLMGRVGMSERERDLALVEPGFDCSTVTTRLDAFLAGGALKFVEYNAENPSSLTDQPGLNRVLQNVAAMRETAARHRLIEFDPARALLDALVETYGEWRGRAETPNVAIVDWAGIPTASEFALLEEYFNARGVPTVVCAPDELEYEQGALRRGDFRVDLVYKRVIIHELLERADDSHPLLRAYREGRVCLVNPFRCKVAHKKAAFELLTDEACAGWFTHAEREAVARTVPWTRRVAERRTTHGGREVDLVEHVRRERARLILKPNDDYGGHGVTLGARVSASEWDEKIEAALAGDYVVQEAVEVPLEEFPVFADAGWGFQTMYVDTNPFLFRGRVCGAMVRLSASPVVNVTSGGGETGFYVIDERGGA